MRPAAPAPSEIPRPAAPASAGGSSEPSHPSASRPTRRSPAGAEPPSQMSSGLAGNAPTPAPDTVKNDPSNDTVSEVSRSRSSPRDPSDTAAPPPPGPRNKERAAA